MAEFNFRRPEILLRYSRKYDLSEDELVILRQVLNYEITMEKFAELTGLNNGQSGVNFLGAYFRQVYHEGKVDI